MGRHWFVAHTHTEMCACSHAPTSHDQFQHPQCSQWLQNCSGKLEAELYVAMDIKVCLEE